MDWPRTHGRRTPGSGEEPCKGPGVGPSSPGSVAGPPRPAQKTAASTRAQGRGTARSARLSQLAGGVRGVGGIPVAGEPGCHPGSAPGSTGGHGLRSSVFVVNCALAPAGHCPPFPGGEAPELRSPAQARKDLEPWPPGPGGGRGAGSGGGGVPLRTDPCASPSSVKGGGAVSCQVRRFLGKPPSVRTSCYVSEAVV